MHERYFVMPLHRRLQPMCHDLLAQPLAQPGLRRWLIAFLVTAFLLLAMAARSIAAPVSPEEAVKTYLAAVYARDYATAYEQISVEDRTFKTKQEYVQGHGAFSGVALALSRALASNIRFDQLRTVFDGDRATVTFMVILPNANDPAIEDVVLEFDERKLAALSDNDLNARLDQLDALAKTGRLPVVEGEHEQWELVREEGVWRVLLNWAGAPLVRFEAVTQAGLPWEFAPAQDMMRAKPGETLQTFYRIKNLADRQLTGKARHVLEPPEETGHLQLVTCFCFLQQTLAPGEEQQLPVVFRVDYDVPASIKEMRIRYEFYPLERFPTEERR